MGWTLDEIVHGLIWFDHVVYRDLHSSLSPMAANGPNGHVAIVELLGFEHGVSGQQVDS